MLYCVEEEKGTEPIRQIAQVSAVLTCTVQIHNIVQRDTCAQLECV